MFVKIVLRLECVQLLTHNELGRVISRAECQVRNGIV